MNDHEYTVGETVFIIGHNGKPSHRTKVAAIKPYKRGPKVTCEDGTEWDVEAMRRWGSRSEMYYTGDHLEPHSEHRADQYRALVYKSYVNWAFQHFDVLPPQQQEALYKAAAAAKADWKARE